MGINPVNLYLFTEWERHGHFPRGGAVLDLGAQELFCTGNPAEINRFVSHFGGEPFPDADVHRIADRGLAGELFSRIGSPYLSIDIKPYPFGIVMDLNHDALPAEHHGRFQMVTNHGTSEHILNQWNVLKTMHDATAVGGIMFHNVPFSGDFEHGLINYNPKFWWLLARDNGYQMISSVAPVDEIQREMPSSFHDSIRFVPKLLPRANDVWIQVLLQKTSDRAFAGITDAPVIG